jgi:alkanesulfonate monooxygenase SsuD/methylene tetrahydromethanopterin reductase-like flavin-dependent oxidoreductase (luciferase family)
MRKVTFGVNLPDRSEYSEIRRVALESERLGYSRVWYCDHIWSHSPECWSLFSALAKETRKIRLGSAVTCNLWREPTLTAKLVASVDVISNGRVEFGIGGGHTRAEYDMYGIRFPKFKERMEMLAEAVAITKSLWTQKSTSFSGKHYVLKDAFCEPPPVQRPHPPIMIGGGGLSATPALAARYADSYNPNADALSPELAKTYLEALDRECAKIGRDPMEIEKIWYGRFFISADSALVDAVRKQLGDKLEASIVGTAEECTERVQTFVDLGFTHFILFTTPYYRSFNMDPVPTLEYFADRVAASFG